LARDRTRRAKTLRRRSPTRPPFDRVLIVCEGEKTEPNYFEEIRKIFKIPSAHIKIIQSELGTQPLRVVESAIKEFEKFKVYDRVYAVFDRDDHEGYANAIAKAEAYRNKLKNDERKIVPFSAIVSVPNFEFWLLLHFEDVRQWIHREEVYNRLKSFISDYTKKADDTYSKTEHLFDVASERAARLRESFSQLPGNEAYTNVDQLVACLKALKS
jgi:hypothetical protein